MSVVKKNSPKQQKRAVKASSKQATMPPRKKEWGKPPSTSTKSQLLSRRHYCARYMLAGLGKDLIADRLREREPELTDQQIAYVYDSVMRVWESMSEETARSARVQATHRLRNDLAALRAPMVEDRKNWAGEVDWAAVGRHERLLAQVEGTLKVVEVRVPLNAQRQALHALIDEYGDDDLDKIVEEEMAQTTT